MVLRCRKCDGVGTYTQQAGLCIRCKAKGMLADGTVCPRCQGRKTQPEFTAPCRKCSGGGTLELPCKACRGTGQTASPCPNCQGTGVYRPLAPKA